MASAAPELNQSGQTMGSKGLRTRRKLIDTTVGLLAKTPLRDVRVVDIAQAANTSAATFYVYFEGVIDAVLAAAADLTQGTPDLIAILEDDWSATDGGDRATAFVEAYVGFWDDHRPLLRLRNLAAEEGDARFTTTREQAVRPLLASLKRAIEKGQAEARIPPSLSSFAIAGTLLMMMERLGALAHLYDQRGDTSFGEMKEAAAHTLRTMLGWPALLTPASTCQAAAFRI